MGSENLNIGLLLLLFDPKLVQNSEKNQFWHKSPTGLHTTTLKALKQNGVFNQQTVVSTVPKTQKYFLVLQLYVIVNG